MNMSYIKLSIAALLPVIAAAILYLLDKKTPFSKLNNKIKQTVFGIIFGALAILGTEWGIPVNGAQANCRDAAVLIGGLLFGAPAGIIAGIIGGVERWIAVAWGVGSFTRLACSLSTIIAGIYSALLRKFMFENKKPGWMLSFAIGVVMEIFHLTMVFITNMKTPEMAMTVVKNCTPPLVISNSISVMLATIVITLLSKEGFSFKRKKNIRISETIQRWMLISVLLAFTATSYFVYNLQNTIATTQANTLLTLALDEITSDIQDASDRNLLDLTKKISTEIHSSSLTEIAEHDNVAEINIINRNGIITDSNNADFINYDMHSGMQSTEFLYAIKTRDEYVQSYGPISYDTSTMRKYAGINLGDEYLQVGYNAEQFQKNIDMEVINIAKNRHVGQRGYILIMDSNMNIVSAPAIFTDDAIHFNKNGINDFDSDNMTEMSVNNVPCYCKYSTTEGYTIWSVLPRDEALQLRNIALYVNTFLEILVFALLFIMIYLLIKRVVVDQIKSINKSLSKITGGNLNEQVNVRSSEEFISLSNDINSTVSSLKQYIAEASARIDKELEFAKNIQTSSLPNVFPAFPKRKEFDIYATMTTAKEVGGDFYDFYMTNSDFLHFLIADVSGKGIPAAMFMMRAKTELKTLSEAELPICDVFTRGNSALCEGNDAGMFVTAWQGNINLETGLVQFANAGHNPPLVHHKDGKFEYLKSKAGFVLAGMDGVKYKTQEIQLEPGDIIYLYTDGVTEATNSENKLYSEDRLLQAINSKEFESMQELCEYIKSDVDAFVGDAPQFDDITMLALKYIGTPPAPSIHFDNASIDNIPEITEFFESRLEEMGCPMKTVIQINIAIDEICSNIIKYAYPGTTGPITITMHEKEDPHTVHIRFCDEGLPYNPLTKDDPDVTLSAEERNIGGLGIFMVKKTMDDMRYKYENEQNILTISKRI